MQKKLKEAKKLLSHIDNVIMNCKTKISGEFINIHFAIDKFLYDDKNKEKTHEQPK